MCILFSHQLIMDTTNIYIKSSNETEIDQDKEYKMVLFYNALDDGWTIKKKGKKTYVFTKKHEGKKEVISDDYLKRFMKEGFDLKKILDN